MGASSSSPDYSEIASLRVEITDLKQRYDAGALNEEECSYLFSLAHHLQLLEEAAAAAAAAKANQYDGQYGTNSTKVAQNTGWDRVFCFLPTVYGDEGSPDIELPINGGYGYEYPIRNEQVQANMQGRFHQFQGYPPDQEFQGYATNEQQGYLPNGQIFQPNNGQSSNRLLQEKQTEGYVQSNGDYAYYGYEDPNTMVTSMANPLADVLQRRSKSLLAGQPEDVNANSDTYSEISGVSGARGSFFPSPRPASSFGFPSPRPVSSNGTDYNNLIAQNRLSNSSVNSVPPQPQSQDDDSVTRGTSKLSFSPDLDEFVGLEIGKGKGKGTNLEVLVSDIVAGLGLVLAKYPCAKNIGRDVARLIVREIVPVKDGKSKKDSPCKGKLKAGDIIYMINSRSFLTHDAMAQSLLATRSHLVLHITRPS